MSCSGAAVRMLTWNTKGVIFCNRDQSFSGLKKFALFNLWRYVNEKPAHMTAVSLYKIMITYWFLNLPWHRHPIQYRHLNNMHQNCEKRINVNAKFRQGSVARSTSEKFVLQFSFFSPQIGLGLQKGILSCSWFTFW